MAAITAPRWPPSCARWLPGAMCAGEIVRRAPHAKGFAVLPKRWLVERTFGWLSHWRRLAKDYEVRTDSSEAMIYLASTKLLLQRLTR